MKIYRTGESIETESGLVFARGWGKGERGSDCLMGARFPSEVMKMF